jgi:hypothetical protein
MSHLDTLRSRGGLGPSPAQPRCGCWLVWAGLSIVVMGSGCEQARGLDSPRSTIGQITIDANYPGGNIIVKRIEGDTVYLKQDLRDTEGWWFYWNFRVAGAAGRMLRFVFADRNPIGVRGPAVSIDRGGTPTGPGAWSWLGVEKPDEAAFIYQFPPDANEVRFCFAIPYQETNLRQFLQDHSGNAHLATEVLCNTRKQRPVERLHAGRLDGAAKHRVLLTARHHACESIANYVLEGIIEAVLADSEDGLWFRRNVEVMAVPFMDKDGVEDGDQGKNRRPHDHNRDYMGKSIYPSVAALRTFVPNWSDGKLKVTLDLHCPYISGPDNEAIYIVGSADEDMWAQQQKFGAILQDVLRGQLPYRRDDSLPFGKAWNTGDNYGGYKTSSRWAADIEGMALAATIEIPYANVRGTAVTAGLARRTAADSSQRRLPQNGGDGQRAWQ